MRQNMGRGWRSWGSPFRSLAVLPCQETTKTESIAEVKIGSIGFQHEALGASAPRAIIKTFEGMSLPLIMISVMYQIR